MTPSVPPLLLALAVDGAFGEYPNAIHPVVAMGTLAGALERRIPRGRVWVERLGGAAVALIVPAAAAGAALVAMRFTTGYSWGWIVEGLLLKATFAGRALGAAALRVQHDLEHRGVVAARGDLASLCSRDAGALGSEQLLAGAIESVAENTSDSVVAPLLFYAVFGLPGAMAYRAVNTLDAMIGYRGAYENVGKASARLDDVLNLIPARLTAFLLATAGAVLGLDAARGAGVWRRDRRRTESPNAGHPMAMMAGLLGVVLAKDGCYVLGGSGRAAAPPDVRRAVEVFALASLLAAGLAVLAVGVRSPR